MADGMKSKRSWVRGGGDPAVIEVGVYGASGYMGGEALRVLCEHPNVRVVWATSRGDKPLEHFHRNFYGSDLKLVRPEEITPCDAVFFAVPTGTPMQLAQYFLEQDTKIIDLGADFRLKDLADWESVYGKKHACPDVVEEAVYGLPELHREAIKRARVIANPGCFASAAILGTAPLVKVGLVDNGRIVVDGLSGTVGAGAELDTPLHHPEIANNLVPYNVVDHRHTYEMEQELGLLADEAAAAAGDETGTGAESAAEAASRGAAGAASRGAAGTASPVTVHFTSSYAPITRGILAICHCFPVRPVTREEVLVVYREFYRDEFFVRVFDMPRDADASWQYAPYPWVSAVSGTNFCHIGLEVDEKRGRVVVFSVLDSVGKGGAHAGVQNLNLLFGLDEKTGLTRYGLHPY
ncbi:MAG: N-acetyl-gamma-glutamyl-phosphate reductase [Thermoleophilia bacterium]|nr:N-acetyl-gamma-glutamyl-phosphate reductase [Thermoleophilia bacterium]